jgi:hypothetical protein
MKDTTQRNIAMLALVIIAVYYSWFTFFRKPSEPDNGNLVATGSPTFSGTKVFKQTVILPDSCKIILTNASTDTVEVSCNGKITKLAPNQEFNSKGK